MKPVPPSAPPLFETEEELRALLVEGLESGEGAVMTREEWHRLRAELEPSRFREKLAS